VGRRGRGIMPQCRGPGVKVQGHINSSCVTSAVKRGGACERVRDRKWRRRRGGGEGGYLTSSS